MMKLARGSASHPFIWSFLAVTKQIQSESKVIPLLFSFAEYPTACCGELDSRQLSVVPEEPVRHCRSRRGEGGAARCEAAGPEKPEVYSLEYIEDFFWPSTTQMVADRSPQ